MVTSWPGTGDGAVWQEVGTEWAVLCTKATAYSESRREEAQNTGGKEKRMFCSIICICPIERRQRCIQITHIKQKQRLVV